MTSEERAHRRACIEETLKELGAPPAGAVELPRDCVMLTSIERRFAGMAGGVTMEVGKRAAAVLIVDGTHRLATEDEIAAYHADQAERKAAANTAALAAEGRAVLHLQPSERRKK